MRMLAFLALALAACVSTTTRVMTSDGFSLTVADGKLLLAADQGSYRLMKDGEATGLTLTQEGTDIAPLLNRSEEDVTPTGLKMQKLTLRTVGPRNILIAIARLGDGEQPTYLFRVIDPDELRQEQAAEGQKPAVRSHLPPFPLGERLPDWTVTAVRKGQEELNPAVSLTSFRGKPLLIEFWGYW